LSLATRLGSLACLVAAVLVVGSAAIPGAAARAARNRAGLLQRCREGEGAAWDAVVEEFSPYVYSIAVRGYRLDHASAEDVFQEVFARTYQHIDRIHDDEALRPWIGQVTRRLCIDHIRASARVEASEAHLDRGADDPALVGIEDAMTLYEALHLLSDEHQAVLTRFFLHDETYETIGKALDLPPGTIASRISRGLSALRAALEDSG
jgi:RNA polymerase sigma-70 factor (ECF subfamily)